MASQVAGKLYESITGQLFEIGRQLRQPNGYPFDPNQLKDFLQLAVEGKFENGAIVPAPKKEKAKLLELIAPVSIGPVETFVATDHFKVDTSNTAEVKIAYIGDNFKANFLGLSEGACEATELKVHKLRKSSVDKPIIEELADKCEIALGQFFYLLSKQGKGETGDLLVNGYANIAYIRDAKGNLWAVRARWRQGYGGWYVDADSVENPGGWCDDNRVVSR